MYMHTCIHTYAHTYIHTYNRIHTYIHTYMYAYNERCPTMKWSKSVEWKLKVAVKSSVGRKYVYLGKSE